MRVMADLARAVAARGPVSSEAAESELYRRFAPRVRLYGLRHLRDEDAARDLVQQVMLVTIEKLRGGSVRDADQIASFVLGVSRTMVKDLKRQSGGARSCARPSWFRMRSKPQPETPRSMSTGSRDVSPCSPSARARLSF